MRQKTKPVPNKKPVSKGSSLRSFKAAPPAFNQAFYANVMAADLHPFSIADRQRIAASIWNLAATRTPGKLNFRIFNPSPVANGWTVDHTVIEIINDDMPFLVDSITAALQKKGLTIHLIIHPVLQAQRDKQGRLLKLVTGAEKKAANDKPKTYLESFMHIQIDQSLDPLVLKEIEKELRGVLDDVRTTVQDWLEMRRRMESAIKTTVASKRQKDGAKQNGEAKEFMRWLDDNNFTYLGYRDIDLEQKGGVLTKISVQKKTGLGILRDADLRMFGGRRDMDKKKTPNFQKYVRQNHLLVITKTSTPSRVHRSVPMDAVFIRRFNEKGDIIGERLFVGLFTSKSYAQNPYEVPFLRSKIDYVLKNSNFRPGGHAYKALVHILNTYPRDELFQIADEDLLRNALGIMQLQDRARVALFARRDPFERFVTCLLYVPRDRYDPALRLRIQSLLEKTFEGRAQDWNIRIDDSLLARIFTTIELKPPYPRPDIAKLENDLRELCRSWIDKLRDSLITEYGEATTLALLRRYGDAFPVSYSDITTPKGAVHDIQQLERASKSTAPERLMTSLLPLDDGRLSLALYQHDHAIPLSSVLPLIESMGLKVEYMAGPFEIKPHGTERSVFIHEFVGRSSLKPITELHHIRPLFEEAFVKIWAGEVENDAFNGLILRAGMAWREIVFMRSFARYLRQLRIPYSHEMIAGAFLAHPQLAQNIYALFFARHNPDVKGNRKNLCREIEGKINEGLAAVSTLEDDRIIRRYINLIQTSLRTNYFQPDENGAQKSYISFKFDSRSIEFMPLPKPLFEIFVYSTRTEAVHLRGGKVARGGIRWSDRRDDFRNEILGLMKAQMVKNSVIVPVGSKGGFIVKRPPAEADKMQAEGIACYRIMMQGLLDITDNRVNGKIIPPHSVVRHDEDDPYLVVAADKGTAKFSDIANGIAQEYKFWLDDAFASGGSVGYDHKGMGITARGAWEAVKRHFREIGKDIQTTDFTCMGVGDMSGDVFGNGMLLSKHTLMLGAFDHRHIFCDPNPDAAVSFSERQRMFNLPRSSWQDYDAKKISKGGGVFARTEKTIKISSEMKKAYGITADTLGPSELIQAMLKAEVELLYFGGIGTFIKASTETHEEVGDRASESCRIDGAEIRAKVVAEGANLGVTQRGRIEYGLKGGRINTDAIDNSAGVDTSDHEVNIKILMRKMVDGGELTLPARNKILESMTDNVGHLVLEDNYFQTQAISVSELRAAEVLPYHMRCINILEKSGFLNRDIEFLPHSAELAERQRNGKGLTRPEIAVILSYAKMWLYEQLLQSDLPDNEYLENDFVRYFPDALQKKYPEEIREHQLRREITATIITNGIINRTGPSFVTLMIDRTEKDAAEVTCAYLVARDALDLTRLWAEIEALDNKVPASAQYEMHFAIRKTLNGTMRWLLTSGGVPSKLDAAVATYRKNVESLIGWLEKSSAEMSGSFKKREAELVGQGIPAALAKRLSLMPVLGTAFDLTPLASGKSVETIAEAYFGLGHRLGLDWLGEQAKALMAQTPWQREALLSLLADIGDNHRRLTLAAVKKGQKLDQWVEQHQTAMQSYDALLSEARSAGIVDMALLSLAAHRLGSLAV